jgi:hypothetical protein
MSITVQALVDLAVIFNAAARSDSGGAIFGYIDPNTMHHVFSFLGPVIAVFVTVVSLTVSVFVVFRDRLVGRFAGWSRLRLAVAGTAVICLLIGVGAIVFRRLQG